jgi:hypothetical protein
MNRPKLSLKKKPIEIQDAACHELTLVTTKPEPISMVVTPPELQPEAIDSEPKVLTDAKIAYYEKLDALENLVLAYFRLQPVFTPISINGREWMRPLSRTVRPALVQWLVSQQLAHGCPRRLIKSAVSKAVFRYVINEKYTLSILSLSDCYDLSGNIDGKVSDKQIEDAKKRLAMMQKRGKKAANKRTA